MKRLLIALMLGFLVWTAAEVAGSEEVVPETPGDWVFSLEAGNRMYPEWSESFELGLGEVFYLGDTAFSARIEEFLPDFRMKDGIPFNASDELGNPAVHVFVYGDSGAADSTWAFLNFPPHFSPKSFFTFQLKDVRSASDSTSAPEE